MTSGYKQTEVGLIPVDWDIRSIAQIAPLQRGFDLPTTQIKDGPYPVVYSNGVMNYHATAMAHGPGVVTGRSGTLGKVHYVDADYWPHNTSLWVTRFNGNVPRFVYYLYTGIGFVRFASGSGVPTLNRNDAHAFRVPLPPTKAEQQAIAAALSDADALIEALEQLIAKKRHLKQGTMQELLTGKKRLPGFSGEWEVKQFGEAVALRGERIDQRATGTQEFCVELEHIGSATGLLLGSTSTGEQSSLKSVFRSGDVLFGKLRAYLRKYWWADRSGVCSTEIWVFSPRATRISSTYLFQLVQTDEFIEAASSTYGTHMPRSDWNVVKNYELHLPPTTEEQTAIAAILSDMDTEIAALETRLAKTRSLKQGMMHNLLTGKVRLI